MSYRRDGAGVGAFFGSKQETDLWKTDNEAEAVAEIDDFNDETFGDDTAGWEYEDNGAEPDPRKPSSGFTDVSDLERSFLEPYSNESVVNRLSNISVSTPVKERTAIREESRITDTDHTKSFSSAQFGPLSSMPMPPKLLNPYDSVWTPLDSISTQKSLDPWQITPSQKSVDHVRPSTTPNAKIIGKPMSVDELEASFRLPERSTHLSNVNALSGMHTSKPMSLGELEASFMSAQSMSSMPIGAAPPPGLGKPMSLDELEASFMSSGSRSHVSARPEASIDNSRNNASWAPPREMQQLHQSYEQHDEYAGLMTPQEKGWLRKIQFFQLEGSIKDPYKEDYYYVVHSLKKLKRAPFIVLPERSKDQAAEEQENKERSRYQSIQYHGTLGKIQVSNINRPRKMVDLSSLSEAVRKAGQNIQSNIPVRKPSNLHKLLLDIERLYLILLDIDYEDKRMAALPESAKALHLEHRQELCQKLFDGLTDEAGLLKEEICSVRKGRSLIVRALMLLSDLKQKA
ncbi:Protein PAT1 -like protein 1 [Halotydeus destructor]|nr:Protein PAT1 -like protein 1 [Halotydeus destructor]